MPDFSTQLNKIAAARSAAEQAENALYQAKIAAAKKAKTTQSTELQKQIGTAQEARNKAQASLLAELNLLFPQQKAYEALTGNLDATLPILMLPVHLETRFFEVPDSGGRRQLLVRIYPDDIHVHTHEALLTAEEIKAGEDYWRALTGANRLSDADKALDQKKAAWQHLREYTGPQRCIWVARATRPTNWTPTMAVADSALQFPAHPETKQHSWTMAPHTQLLPDKFVVSVHGPTQRFDFEGKTIPDTVYLGPDPFYADKAYEKLNNQIVPHVDVAWMHDFSKALEQGLALRIDVQTGFFAKDQKGEDLIPKISVAGLLYSADATKSRLLVEKMLENHYYSRNGFSFVPQGTPTNNTEKDGSGYTKNEDLMPLGYYDGAPTDLPADADGSTFAQLLGIGTDIIREAPNANMRELAEARQMNTALYPATLGYYFERHFSPTVTEAGALQTRQFFLDHVSARGPLPAMRVGDQPYGVLLTSRFDAHWKNAQNREDTAFLDAMCRVLHALQGIWNQFLSSDQLDHVGKPSSNPADVLVKVMGLQAGSVSYTQRLAANHDVLLASDLSPANRAKYDAAIEQKENEVRAWLASLGVNLPADDSQNPPATSIYIYENFARLFDKNFVSSKAGAALKENYIRALAVVETLEELERPNGPNKSPNQILFLLLRHAMLLEVLDQAVNIYEKAGLKAKTVKANKGLFNVAPETENKDVMQMEMLKVNPKIVDNQKFAQFESASLGNVLLKKDNNMLPESAAVKTLRESLLALEILPVDKLERYLANHIDLCFYRLDAWQMGVFYHKIKENRKTKPNGLYIGAYGWVTDLKAELKKVSSVELPPTVRPKDGSPVYEVPDNAGFVHSPSLNHAAATGLLLSGYYNHKKNYGSAASGQAQPFAVNLSSERMRRARFIFEGVQNGQPLDALLGYQFERGLHDTTTKSGGSLNLNQFIYTLREKYPIKRDNIPQQGSLKVEETVSAYPVVNGLSLAEDNDLILTGLGASAKELEALKAEKKRLADTLDAANDLLMAETAYQVVQGNTDRASAVLNALKNADVPSSLEVLKTPRTTQLGFTNRAVLHFRTDMSGQAGNTWTTKTSPRSRMESGLNRWLGQCLGKPETIVCEASFTHDGIKEQKPKIITLDELQIQPIDFVMIVGGEHKDSATELEGRIAQAYRKKTVSEPDDATIVIQLTKGADDDFAKRTFAQVIPLARALRTLITTARPATARDYEGQRRAQTLNPAALYGYDVADMESRIVAALDDLRNKAFFIEGKQPNENDPAAPANYKLVFESFYDDGKNPAHFDNITLSENGLNHISIFLRDASLFGVGMAYPDDVSGTPTPDMLARAASVWQQMLEKVRTAEKQVADAALAADDYAKTDLLRKAGKTILGEDFPVLPRFRYSNGDDMKKSLNDQQQLLKHICAVDKTTDELALENWLQSVVHVRPELEKMERVRMLVEAVGGKPINIDAAQTPYRPKDSWLAVELPEKYEGDGLPFNIQEDTFALTLFGESYNQTNDLQSAFVLDEWTESIPTDREITGIAYHYNQPNAVPPQSLLLAIAPDNSPNWSWENLLGVLEDTLHRAKTRAVEPRHILAHPLLKHLLPMTVAEFDAQEANVSLDFAAASDDFLSSPASNAPLYEQFK